MHKNNIPPNQCSGLKITNHSIIPKLAIKQKNKCFLLDNIIQSDIVHVIPSHDKPNRVANYIVNQASGIMVYKEMFGDL